MMNKRTFLVFPILLFLCLSCGDDTSSGTTEMEADSVNTIQTPNQQAANRQLYHQLMSAKKDPLPIKQILERGKLYPVDEAPKDTSFFIFREQLLQTIQKREVFPLMDIIDPEIKADFGGSGGVEDFVNMWQLDTPEKAKNSEVWKILEQILQNGGTFDSGGNTFMAPYIYSTWPDEYDAFESVAITGSGVRMRTSPSLQSKTLTMLSHAIVKFVEQTPIEETIGDSTHPWVKVQLADETEGFVYGKFVASPIGFRAGFVRQADGKWLMTFLVAGD